MRKCCLLLLFLGVLLLTSCKKKKEEIPVENLPTINIPTGDFWITLVYENGQQNVAWTKDFQSYSLFNTSLEAAFSVFRSGNILLISHISEDQYWLSYGEVSNPSGFSKLNSSRRIYSAAYIDGVVIVLSKDGNNDYRGYCKVKDGETSFTFELLPGNITFQNLYHIDHAVVSNVTVDGTSLMGYTRNGLHWTITSCPGAGGKFEYMDNMTVTKLNGYEYVTSDTSYTEANWTNIEVYTNTTDTVGSFSAVSRRNIHKWWYYGSIYSTATGNRFPAVNISNDHGQTWNTNFLTGFVYPESDQPNFFTTNDKVFVIYYGAGNTKKAFISSDGINFSEITFPDWIEMISSGVYFPG